MIRALIILVLMTTLARADQFDYVLQFANLAALKADATAAAAGLTSDQADFLRDRAMQVQVWRNSQDTTDGQGNVTHTLLPGLFILISLDRNIPALTNHAAVQLVINRDKCNARQAGCIVRSTVSNPVLQDIRIAPVFMGSDFPWGGFN